MNINLSCFKRFLMIFSLLASVALLGGCFLEGDDGSTGPAGPAGADGQDVDPATVDDLQGQIDDLNAALDAASQVEPESCGVCHEGIGEEFHSALYEKYVDASNLTLTITDVSPAPLGTVPETYDVTVTFEIAKNGQPFVDAAGLPSLGEKRMYSVIYDSATRTYDNAVSYGNFTPTGTDGEYTASAENLTYNPTASDAQIYAYIASDPLDLHDELTEGTHVHLYDNVASASMAYGAASSADVNSYVSNANVTGCERCHGTPYQKHGYRAAAVAGLPDFASCKSCHYDTRNGGHTDWQMLVDDPLGYATGTPSFPGYDYSYKAKLMNDVHMAHAMEFPYPQSMANCVVCHDGKLDNIQADDFFVAETCKSCHPVHEQEYGTEPNRAPALETVWAEEGVSFHDIDDDCQLCHTAASGYTGDALSELHPGYNHEIYTFDNDGTSWDDVYVATIDSVSVTDNVLDIQFSATKNGVQDTTDIVAPMVLVSFYGWDTKQFIIPAHYRDANNLRMEKTIGTDNPLFTEEADSTTGAWHVTADLAALVTPYASEPTIPDMVASGKIKRLEVSVRPTLRVDESGTPVASGGQIVAVRAPSATLELASNTIDPDYFKGANAVVEAEKCNVCHDALATTFHSADRHGNITMCKNCHAPIFPGSHLEMQSRSIESYVHAIHSFQAFDFGDVDFTDPVEALKYDLHIEHRFPKFTIRNCEACHLDGKYEVPSQSQSLPGVNSASDSNDTIDRNIGTVPEYVMGPASRACGGCHRAHFINEDDAGGLAAWNQHTKTFGYLVENDADDLTLFSIIENVMSIFE